jgi:hypothetical protein
MRIQQMRRDPSGYWKMIGIKGEAVGHPFRGNQYTTGAGSAASEQVSGIAENAPRTLYHGSMALLVDEIMKEGIRSDEQHVWDSHQLRGERGRSVYMTEDPHSAIGWGFEAQGTIAGRMGGRVKKENLRAAIFKVEVPKDVAIKHDELIPDGAYRIVGHIPPEWIKECEVYRLRKPEDGEAEDKYHPMANYVKVNTGKRSKGNEGMRVFYVPVFFVEDEEDEERP